MKKKLAAVLATLAVAAAPLAMAPTAEAAVAGAHGYKSGRTGAAVYSMNDPSYKAIVHCKSWTGSRYTRRGPNVTTGRTSYAQCDWNANSVGVTLDGYYGDRTWWF